MKELTADITSFLFHLRACPDEFLKPSALHSNGTVATAALLMDVYRYVCDDFAVSDVSLPTARASNHLSADHLLAIQVGCWFFSSPFFSHHKSILPGIENFLFTGLPKLCPYVKATDWVQDEDRAEEFIRLALQCCGLLPKGESEAEATDRLDALNTVKRRAVLQESDGAMQRIKELRQKMVEAKAREAANVYGRE